MTSKIQVPEHIAKELEAEQNLTKEETKIPYVKEEARVLDPTLIEKSILERMPQPTGWRILILPYAGKGVTDGGIQLVQSTVDQQRLSTVVGYVVKMGPDCYKDKSKFDGPWCEEKQWVLIGRYAGARFKLGDESESHIISDCHHTRSYRYPCSIRRINV